MRIIPAIDLIDGKCVRLTQGDYNQKKVYANDPLAMAKAFEDHGVEYLHLVDLDGAKAQAIVNHKVLERIAIQTNLKIDFGGGLKSDEDLRIAFECGAQQVTGGSIAVKQPELFENWLSTYGPEKIILGADARQGKIATNGWLEVSELGVEAFIQSYAAKGVSYVVCTDIEQDWTLQGPSISLYQKILKNSPNIELIASGGVSGIEDLNVLKEISCEAAILGKALYEGRISLKALEHYIIAHA